MQSGADADGASEYYAVCTVSKMYIVDEITQEKLDKIVAKRGYHLFTVDPNESVDCGIIYYDSSTGAVIE